MQKEFYTDKYNEKEFKLKQKVKDHCHYKGKFRGAAHNICNLRYKIPKEIPVVFHNGSTYDYHFIIKQLVKTIIYKLKFIDSFRFMSASLSSLVDNLSKINKKESVNELIEKFPNTCQFCNKDLNKFTLLLRKGVCPYEYMGSWEKFNKVSSPNKESFYSKLNKEGITNEDYVHAQKVWKIFKIKNLGECHDLYV